MNKYNFALRLRIFRDGSTIFYYSSLLFPPEVRREVSTFYAFVRVVDDLVDQVPQDRVGFEKFVKQFWVTWQTHRASGNPIIDGFVQLARRAKFEEAWIKSFLAAMKSDLKHRPARTLEDTLEYMYGSAEVIGLIMTRILNLPESTHASACLQGRAFQYINFIRDIAEDNSLGRRYLPATELKKFGLANLSQTEATKKPRQFRKFMSAQLAIYRDWQNQAELGYTYLSWRQRVPIKTAADMYNWTATQIDQEPKRVFREKIKPRPWRVLVWGIKNLVGELKFYEKNNRYQA